MTSTTDHRVQRDGAERAFALTEAATLAEQALHAESAQATFDAVTGFPDADPGLAAEREHRVVRQLTDAGLALSTTLGAVARDDAYWDRLLRSTDLLGERPLRVTETLALRELVSHQIPPLLDALGYRTPPPTTYWVDKLQTPLRAALSTRREGGTSAESLRLARNELSVFLWRLDRLIAQASDLDAQGNVEGPSRTRALLSEAVRIGRKKAIPAALGAAAGAGLLVVFAPTIPPLAGALTAVGLVAGQELVGAAVEAASARLLGGAPDLPGETPGERLDQSLAALRLSAEALGYDVRDGAWPEADAFVVRRALFDVMSASSLIRNAPLDLFWSLVQEALRSLDGSDPYAVMATTDRLASFAQELAR